MNRKVRIVWLVNMKLRSQIEDKDLHRKTIFKWIFEKFYSCVSEWVPIDGIFEHGGVSSQNVWTRQANFNILLTVHPSIIIVFFTNLIHKFFILMHLLHSSTCFEHHYAHPQEVKFY